MPDGRGRLALSVVGCSRGAPTQEESQQNIHLAHGLEKARVIERAGINRFELYRFTRPDTSALAVSSSPAMKTRTLRPLRLSVGRSWWNSQADVFDRWPSSDTFERRSFFQRRAAFLLRRVPKFLPRAASDFVVAAARTPNNVTIEILWGEVSGFASTH